MIDNIKLRKIRFDVLDYLEKIDLINQITKFIENKEFYKDNIDYPLDLLRSVNGDTSLKDINEIILALQKYIDDVNNIESLDHLSILDYVEDVNIASSEDPLDDEKIEYAKLRLHCFVHLMVQIHTLQSKLLDSTADIMYIGDDNCIYDRATDKKMFTVQDYMKDVDSEDKDVITKNALQFIANLLIDNQRKMVSKLDFDEDGFFVSSSGESLFEKEEKEKIEEHVENWINQLYNIDEEDLSSENLGDIAYDQVVDSEEMDIFDDVSVTKKELNKSSSERISKLKDTLKASSNKIKKY